MPNSVYNSYKKNVFNGGIDLENDTIRMALMTSAYSPDVDAEQYYSDVTAFEVSTGGGYVTSGTVMTGKVVSADNTNDKAVFDADDVVYAASTISARGALIFKDTGDSTTSPLICWSDFGSNKSSVGGNFTISWSVSGIMNVL